MSEEIMRIEELTSGDTTTSETRGSSATTYALEPAMWLSEIMSNARNRWFFTNAVGMYELQPGQKDLVVPIRKKYLTTSDFANTYSAGAVITATKLDNLDGIRLTPAPFTQMITIENYAIKTNAVNLITAAKEELSNYAAEAPEIALVTALNAATMTTTSVPGAQSLYGGDTTSDNTLSAGDILTPEMISQARTYLMSRKAYWWNSTTKTLCSASKNPWVSEPNDPFTLFVCPEVAHKLRIDPQFIDAANYGSSEVVMTGEIGKFVGVKVIESVYVATVATGGTAFDGGSVAGIACARCMLIKPKKAAAIAWGLKPSLTVQPFPREASTDLILELTYQAKVIYNDAVVFLDVALE